MATSFTSILPKLIPGLPAPAIGLASRVLALDEMDRTYGRLQAMDAARPFCERLLDQLGVTCRLSDHDLARVPSSGPVIVVANHPFGILDGAILASTLRRVRSDVRFLANGLMEVIPEIHDLLIPVTLDGADRAANARGLRTALDFVNRGGCLVIFPAGEVSHFKWKDRAICDSPWNPLVARLVEMASRRGTSVPVAPVHIGGANSLPFQLLGMLHGSVRTAMLPRELLNKKRRIVDLRIGSPIPASKLLDIPTAGERTAYLRWRTDVLAGADKKRALPALAPVAPPTDTSLLEADIASLEPLVQCGDLTVYIAAASRIPSVIREIGRLREIAFRAAGEGAGKHTDIDEFDAAYLHLFLWHTKNRQIAGAYRLAMTDQTSRLYTSTLFKYGEPFTRRLGPAIELGRSFISQEYQRGFAPLLALWKGIGRFVAMNPRYKVLFGPVSISNQYQSISRELMVMFLEKHAGLWDWKGLVRHRKRFRISDRRSQLPPAGFDLDDLSEVVSDLEPNRAGVPVLLRQYLRLGGKLLGFNVDPQFADALDGLIMVDLSKTERKLLERYLGKEEAAAFLDYQAGTASFSRP